jgi:hypothetical protein
VKISRVLLWTVFVIVAVVMSITLALKTEGAALQYGFLNGTPGLVVAKSLVPPSSDPALDSFAKHMEVQVAVDAPLWFLAICGLAVGIANSRRRQRMRQAQQ